MSQSKPTESFNWLPLAFNSDHRIESPSGFYVYTLNRASDNSIVYVGKGCRGRMHDHQKCFDSGVVSGLRKHIGMREIIESGDSVYPRCFLDNLTSEEALYCEAQLINNIGINHLLNSAKTRGSTMAICIEEAIHLKKVLRKDIYPSYQQVQSILDDLISYCGSKIQRVDLNASS